MKVVVKQQIVIHEPGQFQWSEYEYEVVRLVDRLEPSIGTRFSESMMRSFIVNVKFDNGVSEVEVIGK